MDDLISRQATVKAIEQHKTAVLEGHKWDEGIEYGYAAAHRHIVDIVEQLPSVQPDTTTHDSNVVKKGGNDEDRISGDCISRAQAIDALRTMQTYKLFAGDDMLLIDQAEAQTELMMLPSVQPEINRSEIPNNSDTISRQAVTKFLNDWLSCLFENCHKQSASDLKMIIKDFKNLPSAQPEPRTAYWTKDIVGSVVCSNCGGIREDNRIGHTQWCNCCGCFMRGE